MSYFALDFATKFYFNDLFIADFLDLSSNWLELYLSTGIGYFKINEGGYTANLGFGNNIWFNDKIGLTFCVMGKWALDKEPAKYDTNHTQFSLGLIYNL